MDKNRKKLLDLIETLKLPLTPEEASQNLEKLTDKEVQALISVYEEIQDAQLATEELAQRVDPQKAEEINKQYQQKIAKLDQEHVREMEKIQQEGDEELDQLEKETTQKLKETVKNQELAVNEAEKLHDDLMDKLNQSTS